MQGLIRNPQTGHNTFFNIFWKFYNWFWTSIWSPQNPEQYWSRIQTDDTWSETAHDKYNLWNPLGSFNTICDEAKRAPDLGWFCMYSRFGPLCSVSFLSSVYIPARLSAVEVFSLSQHSSLAELPDQLDFQQSQRSHVIKTNWQVTNRLKKPKNQKIRKI